ncbi:MAG: hypothetical protein OXQ86_08940 [Gammaproteobacteria bacterium]|nr:hypothetical protein [Gammaproteobacteria bacterium]MDE0414014.1 hypothetical protein [Gammaproteobacteria bacterium]
MQKTKTILAYGVVLGLTLGSLAAAQETHRVVREEGNSLNVEWIREDGSTYRTAETPNTLKQSIARKREAGRRVAAHRERLCKRELKSLSRALEQLDATRRGADSSRCANEPDEGARRYCEAVAEATGRHIPNQEEAVKYYRTQANRVCDSSVMGSARPQALPGNLEAAAQDVLVEALERILGAATQ